MNREALRICQAMLTTSGGSSTVALGLGRGLTERGLDVRYCHLDPHAPPREDATVLGPERGQAMAAALDIDASLSGAIDAASQLVEAHDARPFDLLHLHSLQAFGTGADMLRRLRGVPYVVTLHGSDVLNPRFLDHSAEVVEVLLRGAAAVTGVSRHLADVLQQKLPALPRPRVIHNFLRPDLAERPAPESKAIPPADGGRILHVSSLRPVKRPELALAGFARLRQRRPNATLTLVSSASGLQRAHDLQSRFEGLEGVDRVNAEHDPARLHEAYRQADALLVSSKFEGFGLVLLEALAFGCPVVAAAVAAIPEVLGPSWPWLVADDEEPEAYATALDACLSRPHEAPPYRSVLERFDRDTQIDHYAALYREILGVPANAVTHSTTTQDVLIELHGP